MRKPLIWASKIKRLVFFGVLDNFTFKIYRRREWEAGVLHGIAYAEERIIKLLDAQIGSGHCDRCDYNLEGCQVANLIALIKGEQK